jgi:septal ring factor EnvC (AmiA/AmiB activator)
MAKKFSFILLGGSGTKLKQFHLSALQFTALAIFTVAAVAGSGYAVVDYISLLRERNTKTILQCDLAAQTEEVLHQREQLQRFAAEINDLKNKLVQLDQFEARIRVMANIDQPNRQDGLFGVGGSAPEDLDPNIDLQQRHQRLIKKMHQQVDLLETATANQTRDFKSLLGRLEEQKNLLAHTPSIRPVEGWITSTFGYRVSPFTGKKEFHKGWDIANRKGTTIVATADGIVSFLGKKGNLGNVLVIDHGYGITTRYAHLDESVCKRGQQVQRGQVIAKMGNSGRSTGPHLHYEVRLNGVQVNPDIYILN